MESTAQTTCNEAHNEQSISPQAFPLLTVSRGFCLSMENSIARFEHIVEKVLTIKLRNKFELSP